MLQWLWHFGRFSLAAAWPPHTQRRRVVAQGGRSQQSCRVVVRPAAHHHRHRAAAAYCASRRLPYHPADSSGPNAELEHVVCCHRAALCPARLCQRRARYLCHPPHRHHRAGEQGAIPLHPSILRPRAVGVRRSQRFTVQRALAARVPAAAARPHGVVEERRQLGPGHCLPAERAVSIRAARRAVVAAARVIRHFRHRHAHLAVARVAEAADRLSAVVPGRAGADRQRHGRVLHRRSHVHFCYCCST